MKKLTNNPDKPNKFVFAPIIFAIVFSLYLIYVNPLQRQTIGLQGGQEIYVERYGLALVFDEPSYVSIADNLSSGNGYQIGWPFHLPTAWRMPLYPVMLSGLFLVSGHHAVSGLVLNAVFVIAAIFIIRKAEIIAFNRINIGKNSIPVYAPWLLILTPSVYYFSSFVHTEALAILFSAGLVFAILNFLESHSHNMKGNQDNQYSVRATGLMGILVALGFMARPEFAFLLLLLALMIFFVIGPRKSLLRYLAVFIAPFLLFVTVWILHNYINLGEIVPSTSTGGYTFMGAHNENTYGERRGGWINPPEIIGEPAFSEILSRGEVAMDKALWNMGLEWIKNASFDQVLLLPLYKLMRLWVPYETISFIGIHGQYSRLPSLIASALFFPFWILSLFGSMQLIRRGRLQTLFALLLIPISITVISLIFYGSTRLRMIAYPSLSVLASIGLHIAIAKYRTRHINNTAIDKLNPH